MLEKLQEATEIRWKTSQSGTSQEVGLQDSNLTRTTEPRRMGLRLDEAIWSLEASQMLERCFGTARKHIYGMMDYFWDVETMP
jgi:hypothetical protein